MNYDELVKALRCKRDDCEGCDLAFFDKDEGWMCQYAAKDDDAAAAYAAAYFADHPGHLAGQRRERARQTFIGPRKRGRFERDGLDDRDETLPGRGDFHGHPAAAGELGQLLLADGERDLKRREVHKPQDRLRQGQAHALLDEYFGNDAPERSNDEA